MLELLGWLCVFFFGLQLVATLRAHHGLPRRAVREMTEVTLGGRTLLLFAGLLALLDALLEPLLSDWIPPLPRPLLLGMGLLALDAACLPPTVLYLATSSGVASLLYSEVMLAVAPLKTVQLLDPSKAGFGADSTIHRTGYRVRRDWQAAVRKLCAITPLIIVDARVPSDGLSEEISHLVDSGLHHRSLFISNDDGDLPALRFVRLPPAIVLVTARPQELVSTLRGLAWRCLWLGKISATEI